MLLRQREKIQEVPRSVSLRLWCIPASACLTILAFPNFNFSLLAWVALIPLIYAIDEKTPRQAFFDGWASGTLAYCGLLFWLVVTFHAASLSIFLGLLCLVALSAYLGVFWGAWCWFRTLINASIPPGVLRPLMASASWVALEYIRTTLFSGFPWTLLADSQVYHLPLIQIASVTGVYGVSFLIVWGNLALARAFRGYFRALIPFGLTLILVLSTGYVKLRQRPSGDQKPLKVALLQGNIDQYKKWNEAYVAEIKQTFQTLSERAAEQHVDLMIWPETSVPGYLTQDPALRVWLAGVILKSRAWHVLGAPAESDKKIFNAAFSISPLGLVQGMYAKKHLVPFGETVPFQSWLGVWIPVLNALGGFDSGALSPVLPVAGIPVGINICYEAIFPNLVRRSVEWGGQVIINITNDGWYMKTAAPYQHLAPNIFRAVENHRWLARSDNTGVSALIAPTGDIVAQTPIYLTRVLTGTVYSRTDLTFYTRFGDVFAWACLFFIFFSIKHYKSRKKIPSTSDLDN